MATQGPLYPGTVTTEIGPSGDNDWTTPGNISADDGAEAQITAATYDANDHSYRLRASNFGFTIPSGATIDGITVEIEQRRFAGAAEDQEVRLFDEVGALVGDDKQTATAWPATATIASYGGATDDWLPAGSWTPAQINDVDFGVAHIVLATAANTDIGVDFIRVTVNYTEPLIVTPGTAALTLATFAASVLTPILATIAAAALTLATFAPIVTVAPAGVTVTPSTASLSLTNFAPTVTASDHKVVTPTTTALATTTFAPTVTATANQLVTPSTASLVLTTFEPSVDAGGYEDPYSNWGCKVQIHTPKTAQRGQW